MNILYKTTFQDKEVEQISSEIERLIEKEPGLTNRSLKEIKELLQSQNIVVALTDSKVIGFIMCERFYKDYYEAKGFFVLTEFRNQGIGERLLDLQFNKADKNFFAFTFSEKIYEKVKKYGFEISSLWKMPPGLIIKIISTRRISSIFRHFNKKKSYFIFKPKSK